VAILTRSALGLDLGAHAVKAVELRQTLRGIEVGPMHTMPTQDPEDPRTLGERLQSFLHMHDLPSDAAVVALPGDRLTSRRLSFPFSDRRRLSQAVPLAVEDALPFDLEGMLVDWERVGGDGKASEVTASIAPRAEVMELLGLLHSAGVQPRIVEAEGLVLGNLAGLYEHEDTCIIADLGHRKTTLCLYVDGTPAAARTVRLGAAALTEALAHEGGIDARAAEERKAEGGVRGLQGGEAAAVLDRLVREMARAVGSFEPILAARGLDAAGRMVLLGGGAHLHGIDEYLSERLGALLAAGDPALFAPAAALAARGTARARTRTNFRQNELALRFDVGALGRRMIGTAVLAGGAAVLAGVLAFSSISGQSRRADATDARIAEIWNGAFPGSPVPSNPVAALRAAVRDAHDRAEFLGVYRGNLSALDLLTEISARVPEGLEVIFEELNIDRQVIRIRGHSRSFQDVDRLRGELEAFEPFSQIQVSEITTSREGAKSFSVTISLAPPGGPA
jgi:general secretion pathway protein L